MAVFAVLQPSLLGETAGSVPAAVRDVWHKRSMHCLLQLQGLRHGSCRTAVARRWASQQLCETCDDSTSLLGQRVRSRIAGTQAVPEAEPRLEAKSACARGSSCALVWETATGRLSQPCTHALPVRVRTAAHTPWDSCSLLT